VTSTPDPSESANQRALQYLESGARTLNALGVPAQTLIRTGQVQEEILAEDSAGKYDLLVLGAPLTLRRGEISLDGVVGRVLNRLNGHAALVVRSHYMGLRAPQFSRDEQRMKLQEVLQ